ncbi:lipopolysaccharide biosynthesis protein [Pedobacter frigoris]|uniref:lipopolysaccharide biosynthesis protein n=1 Tax=Pedobacter frigoris TaxID=2571272 RepID=UPI002931BD6B|nr:lipopolysaccharide biosynthesis protein [Pedobacter frigoris]
MSEYIKQSGSHLDKIKGDAIKYLPVKILPAFSGLLTIYILTRILAPFKYAEYTFIFAAGLLFLQLVGAWINSTVLYFYPDFEKNNELDKLKANIISLQLLLLVIGCLGLGLTCYFGNIDWQLIVVSTLLMCSQVMVNVLYSLLQAERQIAIQIQSTILQSVIQIIGIGYCFLFCPHNLLVIFFVLFSSYFFALVFVVYKTKIFNIAGLLFTFDIVLAKRNLLYGLPICLWVFSTQFYSIGDRLILKYFNITSSVGSYASFRDLSVGLSGFLTMPLLLASHPIIMGMWKNNVDKKVIEKLLGHNIRILIIFIAITGIVIFISGEWVMSKFLSAEYFLPRSLMIVIVVSIFIAAISMYVQKALEVTNKTFLMCKITLSLALLSLVINIIVIPRYGIFGAISVNFLSQGMYLLIVYFFSRNILQPVVGFKFIFHILVVIAVVLLGNFFFSFLLEEYYNDALKFAYTCISTMFILVSFKDVRQIFVKENNER